MYKRQDPTLRAEIPPAGLLDGLYPAELPREHDPGDAPRPGGLVASVGQSDGRSDLLAAPVLGDPTLRAEIPPAGLLDGLYPAGLSREYVPGDAPRPRSQEGTAQGPPLELLQGLPLGLLLGLLLLGSILGLSPGLLS